VAVHFREVEYTTAVVSMNKMCEKPLQSATDILKHMATHDKSQVIAAAGRVPAELVAPPHCEQQTDGCVVEHA